MNFLHSMAIGDWSGDGHDKQTDFIFKSNYDREAIIEGYLKTSNSLNIALHSDKNQPDDMVLYFVDFEDNKISEDEINNLKEKGLDFSFLEDESYDGKFRFGPDDVFNMFMAMVKFSLPDYQYEVFSPEFINGYWNNFNVFIGYGVFYL